MRSPPGARKPRNFRCPVCQGPGRAIGPSRILASRRSRHAQDLPRTRPCAPRRQNSRDFRLLEVEAHGLTSSAMARRSVPSPSCSRRRLAKPPPVRPSCARRGRDAGILLYFARTRLRLICSISGSSLSRASRHTVRMCCQFLNGSISGCTCDVRFRRKY